MIVSRADIQTDRLQDFGDAAFLKLPVDVYMGEMGMELIPPQTAVVNGMNNPKYRFGCAALSRRTGKTFIANVIGQLVALIPNCSILIVAPNYSLTQISWELQHKLMKQFNLELVKDNAKDKVIELINGSTIRLGSANQIDSVVGRSYDLIIFDEAALTKDGEEAFNIALLPTLDKSNAKALFISTPRGKKNWFSKFYDRGFSEETPEWFSVQATWKDNPRLSPDVVKSARRDMTDQEFAQEFEADFSVFEGQIWELSDEHVIDELPEGVLQRSDVIGGLDLGFRDPTAFVTVLYDFKTEIFYIVDEYHDAEATTATQAENIQSLMNIWDIEVIYIDSANQQQRYDFAYTYGIPTDNANKNVLDGIGFIGSLIQQGKLKVLSSCTNALFTFDQYRWDPNPNLIKEKPIHDKACHMADAIRYAIFTYKGGALSEY